MASVPTLSMTGVRSNALFRLVVMAAGLLFWMIGFGGIVMPLLRNLGEPGTIAGDVARLFGALVYSAVALLIYWMLVRKIERRRPDELSTDPGLRLGAAGVGFGLMLSCLVVALLAAAGGGHYAGPGDGTRLMAAIAAAAMASVGEELLFRGIMFRIVEQAAGTIAALSVSAFLFGLAHLASPDVTMLTALAIATEAGLMLGMAYVVTRNLWFPIGIHFAWNSSQSGVFGISSAGDSSRGLVAMQFAGPDWLTGGTFGPEASLVAVTLCLAVALAFASIAQRRGQWVSRRLKLRLG